MAILKPNVGLHMTLSSRRFSLCEVIGRGNFGVVHRAILQGPEGFRKPVALKILHPDASGDRDVVERLRDEARLLALVQHRAVVRVDALVQLGCGWAVVMEVVEGAHLRRILQEGAIPPGVAVEIAGEIASALHVAHHAVGKDARPLHLIHRDIKPSNLQLTAAGEVKLLDFGIARADFPSRESRTQTGMLGSLGYMAPERLDGVDDPAGDIYSLGVVLWEMLVGERLGRSSCRPEKHAALVAEAGRRLPDRWASLVDLVLSMLSFQRQERPVAKEVERACRRLRQQIAGIGWREWAEAVVGPIVEANGGADRARDTSWQTRTDEVVAPTFPRRV